MIKHFEKMIKYFEKMIKHFEKMIKHFEIMIKHYEKPCNIYCYFKTIFEFNLKLIVN